MTLESANKPAVDAKRLVQFKRWYRYNRVICVGSSVITFASAGATILAAAFSPLGDIVPSDELGLGVLIGVALMMLLNSNLLCPSCTKYFYGEPGDDSEIGWNIFSRRCKHCGFKL